MEEGQSSQHKNGSDDEEINVYLKVMKTVAFMVKKSDTVRNVKAMLNDKEGISECLQELFFTGERLRDDQKLVDCGIQQNSTLDLFVQNLVPIRLFIKMPSDKKTIVVDARTWDTIQTIKSFIVASEGIHSCNFNLIYAGKLLDDEETLASLNIQGESTLHMVIAPRDLLPISVRMPSGEILKIEVKILYTVRDLKTIVESVVGYCLNDWNTSYDGVQLENSKSLSYYNIAEGSILEMSPQHVQIFVRNCGSETVFITVCLEDLVESLKDKIFRKVGIPVDVQGLVFEGRILHNSRNLASYNIKSLSTVHLVIWGSKKRVCL